MKKITVKFLLERMKKAKENDKEWRTKAAEYVRKHKDEVMTERRPASCKYIQGGETHIYLKCPHCGHVYEPEKGLREYTCPECGVLQDIDDPYKHGLPLYQFTIRNRTGQMIGTGNAVILLEASDRFLTGVYADCLCMYFPDKPNSPEGIGLDGHEEITAEEIKPAFYFAWSRDTGFRTMEGNKDTLSVKRRHIEHLLQLGKYRDQFYCENDYTFIDDNRQDWKTLFGTEQSTFWDAVSELYEKEREQTKKKEMPMTKRQRLIEMYKNYQPEQEQPSVDPWTVVGSVAGGNLICKVEDQFSGQTTMMIACPECRKFRKIMVKGEDILACPSCGKVISRFKAAELGIRDNDTADTMLTTVELTPKGAVLFRTWRVKVTCDFESQTFKENAEEQERLFYDKTGIYWFTEILGGKAPYFSTEMKACLQYPISIVEYGIL